MGGLDDLASSLLQSSGQGNFFSNGNKSVRGIYPAIVVSTDDPLGQNRIKARIIALDNSGEVIGGKDRDVPNENLVYCVPLLPEFFHVRPLVDEMVFIILENPSDNSAPRFWIGPIISSQIKLKYQSYQEAIKMFDVSSFNVNLALNNNFKADAVLPQQADVAIQGRDDADLILRQREAFLSAGKFKPNSVQVNTDSPSNIQLRQVDNNTSGKLKSFSQANVQSSNVNIYSPIGKFRSKDLEKFEVSDLLESFGDLAKKLHPAVFGDELIKLLDLMIRVILTHIHTPQSPLLPTPESQTLLGYSITGDLQKLISNTVRIN